MSVDYWAIDYFRVSRDKVNQIIGFVHQNMHSVL